MADLVQELDSSHVCSMTYTVILHTKYVIESKIIDELYGQVGVRDISSLQLEASIEAANLLLTINGRFTRGSFCAVAV